MNSEFAAAAAQFIQRPKLSRKQIVTRLYRQGLKATFSWSANRDVFIMRAEELRAEFDRYKHYDPKHPCVRARPGRESPYGCTGAATAPSAVPPRPAAALRRHRPPATPISRRATHREAVKALKDGVKRLYDQAHPDGYVGASPRAPLAVALSAGEGTRVTAPHTRFAAPAVNYMPGGCTYQRNEPQPLSVRPRRWSQRPCPPPTYAPATLLPPAPAPAQAVYPDGVPEDVAAKVVPVHPDMVPLTYRPDTGPVLVDPVHAKNIVQPSLMESLQDLEVRQRRSAAEPAV